MGNSYRIKANPGKDQNLVIQVDQDFEQLEILSLKVRQSDIYLRMCSDYGVIAGRVFANNGYGIPNAKVSIFIPVTDEDKKNPVINEIYPYKSVLDTNEDGYKYNLLPYLPSYSNHVPTGTFPTRKDNLVNQTVVQLYDKYYKYTVQTNDSGDYLIYGVPVGSHTIVMNVDLSDIGPFSLGPQDLVRMGLATEEQFDGNKFNSGTNFNTLPQIVVINKSIEVSPFWGEPDICRIGITRTDFDITNEANIDIKPTAIFMGSLVSTSTSIAIKQNCVSRKETGNQCQMITGPGEILAITQSLFHDSDGLPVLEQAKLPNGGKLIDGNGTWMFDLPMNNNYISTNEYGEQVISNDPKVGIPTKSKYRFKIKWQQSKSIAEDYKRGYFLVPNIKEKGWDFYGSDPLQGGSGDYSDALTSYAFDLGWSGYTTGTVDLTNPEILSYINCEDRFYEFDYNKVYTVSGLIDNYKVAGGKEKFLAIKRIDDDSCDDSVNKFPANDGVFHTSLLWIILNILISIIGFLMLPVLIAYDIIAFLINLIYLIIQTVLCGICGIGFSVTILSWYPFAWICRSLGIDCDDPKLPIKPLDMPMITYPDCEACSCDGSDGNGSDPTSGGGTETTTQAQQNQSQFITSFNEPTSFGSLDNPSVFTAAFDNNVYWQSTDVSIIKQLLGGRFANDTRMTAGGVGRIEKSGPSVYLECYDMPFGERINLFNTKGSYYSGANQVKVSYEPTSNGSLTHTDNIIAIVVNQSTTYSAGTMFSFTSPYSSKDPNFTGATVNSIGSNQLTGTTTIPTTLSGTYASPSNPLVNIPFSYSTPTMYNTNVGKTLYYTYPSDIEYFQVITGMTLTNFRALIPASRFPNSFGDVIESTSTIESHFFANSESRTVKPIDFNNQNKKILIIQRGVDPNSFKVQTKFDLSRVFGYSSMNQPNCIVTGDYKVNVPIKNSTLPASSTPLNMFKHDFAPGINNNTPNNGFDLFFNSQFFEPANSPSYYYTGYTTHNHTFYSSLDGTKVVPSTFVPSSPAVVLSPTIIDNTVTSPRKLIMSKSGNALYSSALNPSKYGPNEFVDGGAYVFTPLSSSPNINSYYYSPGYNTGNTLNMSYYKNTVMRSDRLPTSDFPTKNNNNTYFLQQNPALTVYSFSTNGIVVAGAGQSNASYADPFEPTDNAFESNSALNTFTCDKMVSLKCYNGNGLNMTVNPSCKNDDAVTDYGCYRFCPRCGDRNDIFGPIAGMGKDLENFGEYILRFKFFFALCQGVLGQVFNNNWVNGVLVAFPFKINTYYNSRNKVNGRVYCRDIVFLHPTTNTFYYRSTPWDGTKFIGEKSRGDMGKGSNDTNLKYPTTLMNLGPRDSFLKEIILNGNFNGYNMKEFSETSYNDTSDMVNFFGVIRLLDSSFLANFFGSQISKLFTRDGKKVDADFAQTVAVNSQIGVVPLDTSFYTTSPSSPGGASVIAAGGSSSSIMMGVMFTSSTESIQVRDFISPVRTIRWNPLTNDFAYDYTETKSQLTPHYMWRLNNGGSTVFGTQGNNWATSPDPSSIVAVKYQQMDRLSSQLPGSPYPAWNDSVNEYNARGYIFASNANDMASITYNYSAPTIMGHTILGGAPWYFYFGLRKGNTAINRFSTKFIGTTNINE